MTDLPAGPELDRIIAEKVMGIKNTGGAITIGKRHLMMKNWNPSTNIAHAWEVVEKLGGFIIATPGQVLDGRDSRDHMEQWLAVVQNPHGVYPGITWSEGNAPTAPLAICLAALQAVGHPL